jgi:hypothetical protein
MSTGVGVCFALEAAVDEDDVADSERHAEEPPGEAYSERVRTGDCAGEGDVIGCAGRVGQQNGIEPPAGTGEHEEQVEA